MSLSDRTRSILVLLACLAVSLVCVLYPMYVIRPFRHQGSRELAVALDVFRYRAVVLVLCLVATAGVSALYAQNKPGVAWHCLKLRPAGQSRGDQLAP